MGLLAETVHLALRSLDTIKSFQFRINLPSLFKDQNKIILRISGVQVTLSDPVLSEGELSSLQAIESLKPATLPTFFDVSDGIEGALQRGLDKLCEAADEAVRSGSQLLILSDRTDNMVCS